MSLRIDLRPSRLLSVLQVFQMLLAIVATGLLVAEFPPASLLLLPIGLGLWRMQHANGKPRAIVLMENDWYLVYAEHVMKAELCDEFHCTDWLQIIQFRVQSAPELACRRVWALILPDSATGEDRRRLRVVLRWHGFPGKSAMH